MSPQKKNNQHYEKDKRFGAWTGKTPLTLLNEICDKQGWKFKITTTKDLKSDICIFQGKKTLKYSHSHSTAQDAQDARHFAATFALFQIAGHLSMRNLLPPNHCAYWKELQNEIPSAASSQSSVDGSRGSLSNNSGKSPLPSIYLDQDTRSEIEALIRGMGVYNMLDVKLGNKWKQMLVNYGFRKSHVEEAANYTTDLQDAIHWLCIHVPEDGMSDICKNRSSS
jgi:ATP-dependent RNA helicase DHX57